MIDTEILSGEHAELDAIACALLALVEPATARTEGLSSLRWRLNRVLAVHLAKEDKLLYPMLARSADLKTRSIAMRFAGEMGGLAADYQAYATHWTLARIEADWPQFRTATRRVITALRRRIKREEAELYPRIGLRAAA